MVYITRIVLFAAMVVVLVTQEFVTLKSAHPVTLPVTYPIAARAGIASSAIPPRSSNHARGISDICYFATAESAVGVVNTTLLDVTVIVYGFVLLILLGSSTFAVKL